MRKKDKLPLILGFLHREYPDARCALLFHDDYECLFAIALSAQTSDRAVNMVTPALFARYPDVESLSKADEAEVRSLIVRLGLAKSKAHNLVLASRAIVERFSSQIPSSVEDLTSLPGIGLKTASVYLLERKGIASLPVDTHVGRIAVRLGLAEAKDSPGKIKEKLEAYFPKEEWHFVHLAFIAFGRNRCRAVNPDCSDCPLIGPCSFRRKKKKRP